MLHAGRTARVVVWGRLCCPLTPTYTGVPCPTRSHPPGPAPRRKPSWPTTTAHPTPGVEVRVEDWRDHKTERPYDSVISVAAFEAFVHRGMEPAAKMAADREFFDCCDRMLVDEGRLSIQTIAYVKPSTYVPADHRQDLPRERIAADLGADRRRGRHVRAVGAAQRLRPLLPYAAHLGRKPRGLSRP